jgi:hypothetical protein
MEHVRKCDWYISIAGSRNKTKSKIWVTITSLVTYSWNFVDPDRFGHITLYRQLREGD